MSDNNDYSKARSIDDDLEFEDAQELALKRLVTGLVLEETIDMGPVECVARIIDRIDEIDSENERLRERVGKLEAELNPNPESKSYQELSRDEKVQQLREHLVSTASAQHNGKYAMEYKDVVTLFEGNPSPGHAYDLMEIAGNADGFEFKQFGNRTNRIQVNLRAVNDDTLFHAANNGISEVGP